MTTTNEGNNTMDTTILDASTLADLALDAALDAACAVIQDALGQTDGGFAVLYFDGGASDDIRRILRGYIAAERAHLAWHAARAHLKGNA